MSEQVSEQAGKQVSEQAGEQVGFIQVGDVPQVDAVLTTTEGDTVTYYAPTGLITVGWLPRADLRLLEEGKSARVYGTKELAGTDAVELRAVLARGEE